LFAGLGQLSERSAAYFIEQFQKSKRPGSGEERRASMELALACGGSAAADFVNMLLNDGSLDSTLRRDLLMELGGTGNGPFSICRLPIGDALAATAMTMGPAGDAAD